MAVKEVTVSILDRNYKMRIGDADETHLLAAAQMIDRQAREYSKRYAFSDHQDLLAMAALGPVTELQKMNASQTHQDTTMAERLTHINGLLETALRT